MNQSRVLVTGSSGNVGKFLTHYLNEKEIPYLSAKTTKENVDSSNMVYFNFLDSSSFNFNGFDKVFLMRPPTISNIKRDMLPALKWFKEIGVKHVVLMSVQGAQNVPWIPHRKLELAIQELGFTYTFVRPSFFMQNISGVHAEEIKFENKLFVPAGNIKMSFIDTKDIAEACACIFSNLKQHINKEYTLTGPEALGFEAVAQLLSEKLERKIVYKSPSMPAFAFKMRKRNLNWKYIGVMTMLYVVSRLRPPNNLTDDFKLITGHIGTRFSDFTERELNSWIS